MSATGRRANSATARLKQDYLRLKRDPIPYVLAEPLGSNILEWHYVVQGPEATPYHGGLYHGKLIFPREFPFKPPSIYMLTPNGRFKVNTRLCLSISDFHPDTWNPAWSVSSILTGLLSFMLEKSPTLGSVESSDYERRQLAVQSLEFNLGDRVFCELFPETVEEINTELARRAAAELSARAQGRAVSDVSSLLRTGLRAEQGALGSALANVAVVLGFAAFAYTVKYVLRNIALE